MASVSVEEFLKGVLAAGTGQIAGRLAGEQQRMQRESEDFSRQAQIIQLQQQPQQDLDRVLMSQLPNMTPTSQATFMQNVADRPNPYGELMQTPYAQRLMGRTGMPRVATATGAPGGFAGALTGQRAAPTVAPAVQTGGGPSFTAGGQRYELRGVTKEQMTARRAEIESTRKLLQNYRARDPNVQVAVQDLLKELAGADVTTPEGYSEAGNLLSRATAYAVNAGSQAQSLAAGERDDRGKAYDTAVKNLEKASPATAVALLDQMAQLETAGKGDQLSLVAPRLAPFADDLKQMRERRDAGDTAGAARLAAQIRDQLKSEQDPRQEAAAVNSLISYAARLPASQASDVKFMRGLFERFGLGHLLPENPNEAPFIGGARADERLHQAIQRMSSEGFAKLGWAAQRPLLDEIAGLSKLLKMPVRLPEKVIANLTPYQVQYLRLMRGKFSYQQTRDAKKDREKQKEEEGKLTQVQRESLRSADRELRQRNADLRDFIRSNRIVPAEIDETDPKDEVEQDYLNLRNLVDQAEGERDTIYRQFGIRTPEIDQSDRPSAYRPNAAPKPKPPPPKPKGPLDTVKEAAVGAFQRATGQQPAKAQPKEAPRQVLSNAERLRFVQILMGRGKTRAEAERIAGQYAPR